MDPDANLREQQTIAHRIIENHYTQDDAARDRAKRGEEDV